MNIKEPTQPLFISDVLVLSLIAWASFYNNLLNFLYILVFNIYSMHHEASPVLTETETHHSAPHCIKSNCVNSESMC
jgi:hypothetical protein